MSVEQSPFKASAEILDSIRTEASALSPSEAMSLKEHLVTPVIEKMLERYGDFVSDPYKREEIRRTSDRLIVLGDQAYEDFDSIWDKRTDDHEKLEPQKMSGGTYYQNLGQFATIRLPDKIARSDLERHPYLRNSLPKDIGSEEQARLIVFDAYLKTFVVHEIIHAFPLGSLPTALEECGVRYYAREMAEALNLSYVQMKGDEEKIAFYQSLIDKYGDDVHHVFFGGQIDHKRKGKITAELTPEIENQLFSAEKAKDKAAV